MTNQLLPLSYADKNGNNILEQNEIVEALRLGGINAFALSNLFQLTTRTQDMCTQRDVLKAVEQELSEHLPSASPEQQSNLRENISSIQSTVQRSDTIAQVPLDAAQRFHMVARAAVQSESEAQYRQRLTEAGLDSQRVAVLSVRWWELRNNEISRSIGSLESIETPTVAQICDGLRPATTPLLEPDVPASRRPSVPI
jgi:hypothetical protein